MGESKSEKTDLGEVSGVKPVGREGWEGSGKKKLNFKSAKSNQ